jgi:predicted metalloprotease with PDZ domain
MVGLISILGLSILAMGWFRRNSPGEESHPSGVQDGPRQVSETRWVIPRRSKASYLSIPQRVNREIHLKPILGQMPDSLQSLVIEFVDDRSPFHSAGFRKNDRILKVNNEPVATLSRSINLIHEIEASARVTVQVEREGRIVEYQFDFD